MTFSVNNHIYILLNVGSNWKRRRFTKIKRISLFRKSSGIVRLKDKLGKQNFHEDMEKVFERKTNAKNKTSENITKTIKEISIKNIQTIENLNSKLLEIMNDEGIIASCFLSLLSKVTDPENTSQFKLVKDSSSNRVNDLLIHNTIPIIYLTICKQFVIQINNSH